MMAVKMTPPLVDRSGDLIPENTAENAINKRLVYIAGAVFTILLSAVLAISSEILENQHKFNTYIETNNQAIQYMQRDLQNIKTELEQHKKESFEDRRQLNDRMTKTEAGVRLKYYPQ